MASWSERCPECGFDPPTVSPSDAAVAARSYPRRWRALLVRPDEDDPEVVHRRPVPDEPSAIERAAAAAAGLRSAADALHQVHVHDDPEVSLDGPAAGPGRPLALAPVLGHLEAAAAALADAIAGLGGDEWRRPGREATTGSRLTAVDLARYGAHAGIHHLRAAERALRQVRRGR